MMPKYLQSKQRFGLFVACVSLCSLVGCASPYRAKFTANDVIEYQINCDIKDEQLAQLTSLKNSDTERLMAKIELGQLGIFVKDREYKQSMGRGRVNWWIDNLVEELNRCPS